MQVEDPRELGIGVVYTPRLARVLDLNLIDVLEIEPQMFWRSTGDSGERTSINLDLFAQLREMPQHKLVHSVTLPVGNSRPHDAQALERLRQSIATLGAPYASEHLSFDRFGKGSAQLWTGFFLPPKQDKHAVENAAARIEEMRRAVGVPVAFETGVNYLRPQADELSDGCFMRSVAEAANCGILLDLHNLLTNERNGRDSIRAVFDELPRDRVWEIHLAGGMRYRGYWLDSHSGHIEDELFDAARGIVDECPNLRAIVFEIMDDHVLEGSRDGLRRDVERLRSLWTERRRSRCVGASRRRRLASSEEASDPTAVRRREETLGALALGHAPHDPDPIITADPGAALYTDLVASMREGAICDLLPFLVRLLLVSIGPKPMMDLIAAFHASVPPEPFRGDEVRHFIAYVRAQELPVPHLAEILDFEDALISVGGTFGKRTVTFDCDPETLLGALVRRERPDDLSPGRFDLEVSTGGIKIRARGCGASKCVSIPVPSPLEHEATDLPKDRDMRA